MAAAAIKRLKLLFQGAVRFSNSSLGQQPFRCLNCNRASICKVHREIYVQLYPTVVVLPDGSTINIRYHEPRKIIKLPLDLSTLTEAERLARLEKRKPKQKVKIEEDVDDGFDARKYVHLLKKEK